MYYTNGGDLVKYKQGYDAALETIMSGENCVVIGPGGSGKSMLIHTLMQFFEYDTILAASSGIAARNIGGATCHSTFKLPVGFDLSMPKIDKKKRELLGSSSLSRIIIDEAFMLRSDSVDHIDARLKAVRRNNESFGGIQKVMFGDPFQLPPIVQAKSSESTAFYKHYQTPHIFGSKIWDSFDYTLVELDKVMRQENEEFSKVLCNLRTGVDIRQGIEYINDMSKKTKSGAGIILATTRNLVSTYNQTEFNKLRSREVRYQSRKKGKTSDLQIEDSVSLKEGCRVIITCNATNGEYVNGSLGVVTKLAPKEVLVELDNGKEVWIPYTVVPCYEYVQDGTGNIKKHECGRVEYLPLMLGYAITIHRSQGLTLDDYEVDLGFGAFCSGQAYTALSRARSIEGLYLKKPLRQKDIIVDKDIVRWLDSVRG